MNQNTLNKLQQFSKANEPLAIELAKDWSQLAQEGQKIYLDVRTKASNKVLEAADDWLDSQKKLYLLRQEAEASLKRVRAFEGEFNFESKLSQLLEKTLSELDNYFSNANKYESKLREAAKLKV